MHAHPFIAMLPQQDPRPEKSAAEGSSLAARPEAMPPASSSPQPQPRGLEAESADVSEAESADVRLAQRRKLQVATDASHLEERESADVHRQARSMTESSQPSKDATELNSSSRNAVPGGSAAAGAPLQPGTAGERRREESGDEPPATAAGMAWARRGELASGGNVDSDVQWDQGTGMFYMPDMGCYWDGGHLYGDAASGQWYRFQDGQYQLVS